MEQHLFQIESGIDCDEKLSLLNFMVREFDLDQLITLSGKNLEVASEFSFQELSRRKLKADLIYCDLSDYSGNYQPLQEKYFDLISKNGVICIDGVDGSEIFNQIPVEKFEPLFMVNKFFVFAGINGKRSISSMKYQIDLFRRKHFFELDRINRNVTKGSLPLVAVVVLTYKHENYITECLGSVFRQTGMFRMRIIIIDDASSDKTASVVQNIISDFNDSSIKIEFISNKINCGVVKNLSTAVRLAAGCDYLTFCEGDDFWSSDTRVQNHLDFLKDHPECVMSFNTIELCSADGRIRKVYEEQAGQPQDVLCAEDLAATNIIGNFSACFYDGSLIKIIPEKLFDIYTVDWMFNVYCAQFGGIGHLRKPLSVYRQHGGGEWSSRQEFDKAVTLSELSSEYNCFLDYQYNEGWQKYKKILLGWMCHHYPEQVEKFDLLILDDVFPSKCSGFRYAEFTAYLKNFPRAFALVSGATLSILEDNSLNDLIRNYQRRYPEMGNRIMTSAGDFPIRFAKLLYVNFLNNAYALLPIAEEARVSFAFTLYPGGGFVLGSTECDSKLRRIFDSPSFRKVIVTQQISYDYLIERRLCPADKIEMIFGVVMPQDSFVDPIPKDKIRWGFGKQRMDICFMAHRYTPHGEDKGYDVFINAACRLRKKYDDIYFHIVGPYDRRLIDVSPIHDRVEFHGTLNPEQMDDFFKDMDIIMSPNISGKIRPGSFDGFPTASCTEGGLRGTAIFCTDEFNSAEGHFVDGQDFVLIKYDLNHIVTMLEHYYCNPEALKAIGECGSRRIQNLYSYQSQMAPRVQMLKELIASPFIFDVNMLQNLKPCLPSSSFDPLNVTVCPVPSRAWKWLKKRCPESLRQFYRKFIKRHVRPNHV